MVKLIYNDRINIKTQMQKTKTCTLLLYCLISFFVLPRMAVCGEGPLEGVNMRIRILFDNYNFDDAFESSWGFSCIITMPQKTILFDTGNNEDILSANMTVAGIDIGDIDMVFISHAHWDHTGGLLALKDIKAGTPVYVIESAVDELGGQINNIEASIEAVVNPREIMPGVFSTGEMDSDYVNEHSLVVNTGMGGVLITGCAHPGIVNIVDKAMEITGEKLLLTLGGFHLKDKPPAELEKTANELNGKTLYTAPSHCTGDDARAILREKFGSRFIESGAGKTIELDKLQ
ncbi:MAG: MBL fold metallo-hydrolase [candidate division Zixibacteria bacterium]|nr:MBL fold metallo-hydrolase [candidate division Zixibacteria bacterium]